MKALSIKQPYAGLIMAGIKTVENRTWIPKKSPGLLAIVATATPDAAKWWAPMRSRCRELGATFPESLCKINGAVLGIVTFDYVIWLAEDGTAETDAPNIDAAQNWRIWWNPDMMGFILSDPRPLIIPIPIKGQLGLYNLADVVEAQVNKQLKYN